MSLFKRLFASIQTRLLAVFLVNTMLTVALVVVFTQQLGDRLNREADNALLVNARQVANQIDEFNRSNKQALNLGGRLLTLVEFLQAHEAGEVDQELLESTHIILDAIDIEPWDQYYVISQALLDRNGINIFDTAQGNIGDDESQQDYFRNTLLGGTINTSPIQFNAQRGGIYFYYAIPIRKSEGPTSVVGVLRIQMAISSVQNIVLDSALGQEWDVALFDENFVRIADSRHEDLLFRSIVTYSPDQIAALKSQYALPPLPDSEISQPVPSLAQILANTHDSRVVSGIIAPGSDIDQRMAVVKLDTLPWYLVVSLPADEHFRSVQQQSTGLLVLSGVLLAVALASSFFLARRLTRPIRVLTAAAKQVAAGDLHIKAPITSSDEVGTLAKTFNRMTTELEIAHNTLEERVAQRTRELSEANEKLTHEILERQRYEQQALDLALEQQRRRVLAEFIRKASHEFRTPLSIISVQSYLVKQFVPEDKQRYVTVIEKQGRYIEGLVNRMVLMTRLDGGLPQPTDPVLINDIVAIALTGYTELFEEKHITPRVDLQTDGVAVLADAELLLVTLQNLLDNAISYSVEPITITITACVKNGMVMLAVGDKGIGIPAALHERVFERFFRIDEAHTTRGFGLGLPIAKLIIENFGGTITLTSEEGQGTTITISLPVAAAP